MFDQKILQKKNAVTKRPAVKATAVKTSLELKIFF